MRPCWKGSCLPFLAWLLLASSLQAQEIEWEKLNAEFLKLFREGQYDQAVLVGRKALRLAEANAGPDHSSVGTSLNMLAMGRQQGEDARAEHTPLHWLPARKRWVRTIPR